MNGRILVMCASRGRTSRFARMVDSVRKTATIADIVVYVDDDQTEEYGPLITSLGDGIRMLVGPRIGQCASLNHLAKKCPGYEAYGSATDDCTFETEGWDKWVMNAKAGFRGGVGLISPWVNQNTPALDGVEHPRMDFPWCTAEWLDIVGTFTMVNTRHQYWDVALQLVGEMTAIAFAKRTEWEIWHEALAVEERDDDSLKDVGKLMYQIYHIHNDARIVTTWAAKERQSRIAQINKAINLYAKETV